MSGDGTAPSDDPLHRWHREMLAERYQRHPEYRGPSPSRPTQEDLMPITPDRARENRRVALEGFYGVAHDEELSA